MIQLKLLELKDKEILGFNKYSEFVEALNRVLGYTVEKAYENDPLFDGYYLMPIGARSVIEFDEKLINEKVFLLSVINTGIPQYIEKFKPAGLTNWRFFKDAKTTIDARLDVLKNQRVNNENYTELRDNDAWYRPYPSDGTYETVAKSILKYLELYDNYLKNK